ncbi:LINE-1 reverse transcriptase-like protein [Bienertia sinuspersici]
MARNKKSKNSNGGSKKVKDKQGDDSHGIDDNWEGQSKVKSRTNSTPLPLNLEEEDDLERLLLTPDQSMAELVQGSRRKSLLSDWMVLPGKDENTKPDHNRQSQTELENRGPDLPNVDQDDMMQNAMESQEDQVNKEEGKEVSNQEELTSKDPVFNGNSKKCGVVGRKSPNREMGGSAIPISNAFDQLQVFVGRSAVAEAFEQYYKMLLGTEAQAIGVVQTEVIQAGQIVSAEQAQCLMRPFSMADVKNALFSIDGGKSPGPDGFNSSFFKLSWPILGNEISAAVLEFFQTGRLLREINNTNITLIPKVNNPMSVTDFRPIACCNTIYKIISKILCSRLKELLPDLISEYQSGFIKGRKIFHNICIIQDLIGKYKRKNSPPGCMFKVDIRKAYDSIRWEFLDQILRKLNFPTQFVDWIMMCVSTPAFSLNINGETCGYFKGKRGLRQGDPISPLLFVICMDYLSRLLVLVGKAKGFDYHPRCKTLGLSHLAFADDLIIMCKGDSSSARKVLQCLATFADVSGLVANEGKSNAYFCNVASGIKEEILKFSGFKEGQLPFKYLGIQISSKKLSSSDCSILVEKIIQKIRLWGSRSLSYAGRVLLVNSVLMTMHVYWSSIVILPKKVIQTVMAICRNFLWDGKAIYSRAPPIAWELVCRPKKAGGLGIQDCYKWNIAALGKYIWDIANKNDSLWLKWVNHHYIKGKNWKRVTCPAGASWQLKQLWEVKDTLKHGYRKNVWLANPKGYTIASGYSWLRGDQEKVDWSGWVWNRLNIPKHRFICWLAMWNRLKTRSRLVLMGVTLSDLCPCCEQNAETLQHLLFECPFGSRMWDMLKEKTGVNATTDSLQNCNVWLQSVNNRFRRAVLQSMAAAVVYHIWRVRNDVIWNQAIRRPDVVFQSLYREIYWRILSVLPKKISLVDRRWLKTIR